MPNVGRLEPGATYVYERDGPRVYARKVGEIERTLIGEDYALDIQQRRMALSEIWMPVLEAAEHNPALQDALDRAKVIYELSKQESTVDHHPV
jgi:hypothetical protein